jgi:hypothetical protein
MSAGLFNIARGKFAYYAGLPASADALIVVLLKSGGLESDGTLMDYATLSDILAASNDEADFTSYTRKTLATVAVTVDNTNNRVDVTADNFTYTSAGGATNNTIAKLLVCYDGDTGAGTDANIIPLSFHDCSFTTDGTDQPIQGLTSPGFLRAS